MLKILNHRKIDNDNHSKVTFIRLEPTELSDSIKQIIVSISDLSWLHKFKIKAFLHDSFLECAKPTIDDIEHKLLNCIEDGISSDAGEYIVSELSRQAILQRLKYSCPPIAEIHLKQKSGNPGFDFHAENLCNTILFGEAKYKSKENAYGVALTQVLDFIKDKKDIKDLKELSHFFSEQAIVSANKGEKGYAIAFSAKTISTEKLIENIINNEKYKELRSYHEIILVAVNI